MKNSLLLVAILSCIYAQDYCNWPGFRGNGNSQTQAKNLPTTWSNNDNIAWRLELEGYGQSSPIVWQDKVFVTSSSGDMKENLVIHCADLNSGKFLWKKSFESSHKSKRNKMVAQSAPTPITDAQNIYAFFESGDLIALNHQGKELWKRNLSKEYGVFKGNHGVGGSLAQTNTSIIILAEHEGPSYLLSINKKTGKNDWIVNREPRVSWSSPIVTDGKIIVSSNGVVEVFTASSGKRLWFLEGIKKNTVPSPSFTKDLIIVGSSAKKWCLAIKRNGSGNAKDNIAWKANTSSSFGSPLVHKQEVYFVNRAGVLTCVNLQTGEKKWSMRLPGSVWASPIASNSYLYFFCKDGTTVVGTTTEKEFKQIAQNKIQIGTSSVYGIAAVHSNFIVRTGKEIICIRGKKKIEQKDAK